jgi:hypothetical protein
VRKALIHQNKVIQIEDKAFEVAPPLYWLDCGDDVETNYILEDDKFVRPVIDYYKGKTVDEAREIKIAQVKRIAETEITKLYPLYKQANIIRAGGADLQQMSVYIDGIRDKSNLMEQEIDNLDTKELIFKYGINYD